MTAGVREAGARRARRARAPGELRWFEFAAVRGVWVHELALFRRYYRSQTFASVVEPLVMMLAFGYGFGALVPTVAGYRYLDFVATGVIGVAALYSSVFPGIFNTYVRRTFQHSYDGMLAAPLDVHELVTAEALWVAAKTAVYGCVPLLVGMAFGLDPSLGMLLCPPVVFCTGLGFALFGMWVSALASTINSFDYVITGVIAPLMLMGGAFFPVGELPGWARTLALANPVHHCVTLVRHAVFGLSPVADLAHLGALLAFAAVMWLLAVRALRRKLIG